MDASSPEAPTRKRKDSISDLKREKPLFASRRFATSQQPPDFFTESLNTSYVHSPSPARSLPKRQHGRPNSRQFSSGGRSLAAAFKATPNTKDENQRPLSASPLDKHHAQSQWKPLPDHSSTRPQSSPAGRTGKVERVKTPSPARGRTQSFVSPVSSQHSQSSPPRGLAEAYQRIVDEESLAQEESVDDMDAYGYDDYTGRSGESGFSDELRAPDSASPTSLKASRKASREPTPVRDPSENKENDLNRVESGSQRSSLEDGTERSFSSSISRYNKDSQRLSVALRSNVKIFSKARVGERVGLTVENLRRRNDSAESLGSAFGGSFSSRGSDPSLNLPKAWGRKAKPPKDWLSRINSKSGKLTGDVPKRQKADSPIIAESERREWDEPIDEWVQAAADIPLPSEENGSSQLRSSSTTTPSIAQNTLRNNASGWDVDADFTGRSLQVSDSPPLRTRSTSSDEIRNREIDRVARSALATSRLGEIRERTSQESLRRTGSRSEGSATPQNQKRSASRWSGSSKREDRDSQSKSDAPFEGDGEAIPDTPIVVYRSTPDLGKGSSRERPSHERHDSRGLLQKLARATSSSPVSSTEGLRESIDDRIESRSGKVTPKQEQQSSKPEHGRSGRDKNDSQINSKSSKAAAELRTDETPVPSQSKSRLRTPQITGGWIDNTMTEETLRTSMPSENLKTPLVTGAWVDTPLPAGGRGPPMPTPNVEDDKDFILEGSEKRRVATSDLIQKLSPKPSPPQPLKPPPATPQIGPRIRSQRRQSLVNNRLPAWPKLADCPALRL